MISVKNNTLAWFQAVVSGLSGIERMGEYIPKGKPKRKKKRPRSKMAKESRKANRRKK